MEEEEPESGRTGGHAKVNLLKGRTPSMELNATKRSRTSTLTR